MTDGMEGLALAEHYKLLEGEISKRMDCCSASRRVLELPSKLCGVLGMKADMGIRLKKAYDSADGEMLSFIVDQEIPELLVRLEELQETHYKLWMNDYKSFGWEVLDLRYGGVIARLKTVKNRVSLYLSGDITELEELVEERLYFDDRARRGTVTDYFTAYHRMATPNIY